MRGKPALTIVGAAVVVCPSAASAEVESSASMTPTTISFPQTRQIVYRLALRSGPQPEDVVVRLDVPEIVPGGAPVGTPIRIGAPRLDGPGGLSDFQTSTPDFVGGTCFRGYGPGGLDRLRVSLPANSRSTLVVPARTGRVPPWPGADLRLGFRVNNRRVLPPRPRLRGLRGVRIGLTSRPSLGAGSQVLPLGSAITFRGSTRPALRRRTLALLVTRTTRSRRRVIVFRVKTNGRGRFVQKLRFRGVGGYDVLARYRGHRRFARDESCGTEFFVQARR